MSDQIIVVTSPIPGDLADQLRAEAQKNERSMAAEIRIAIRNHLAQTTEENAA